jgi:hypothetical protein
MKRAFVLVASVPAAFLLLHGASAPAWSGTLKPAVAFKARPLPISDVRLTGGPLKAAQDQNGLYLLSLEVDRMMAFLRTAAGLPAKAEGYGGWDGSNRQLTGHIAGHYLSGVSLMWAATGDTRFKERVDRLVDELKIVQDKHGDGYIGAQSDRANVPGKTLYQQLAAGDIRSAGFDLNGRLGHGEPRPARGRHLLRFRQRALGQHLRAFDGGLEGGGRPAYDDDRVPGRGGRRPVRRPEGPTGLHRPDQTPGLGGARIRHQDQRNAFGGQYRRAGRILCPHRTEMEDG